MTGSIFTVTGVGRLRASGEPDWNGFHAFGWQPTLEAARESVLRNEADINEGGHYPVFVVEEVLPGMYPSASGRVMEPQWFEWSWDDRDRGRGHYEETGRPDWAGNIIGFSFG